MNNQEQKTADVLLEKLSQATANEVIQFANAYQALTQGALNRVNSEFQRNTGGYTKDSVDNTPKNSYPKQPPIDNGIAVDGFGKFTGKEYHK